MEPLVFDSLELIQEDVIIVGKKYILKEAPEALASRYQNEQLRAMKVVESQDGSKTANVSNISDTEALLVSMCLFEVLDNGNQKSVELQTIKNWPHRVVKPLFERAEIISGLKNRETEQSLKKQIKALQDKLVKLQAEGNNKNEVATIGGGSINIKNS